MVSGRFVTCLTTAVTPAAELPIIPAAARPTSTFCAVVSTIAFAATPAPVDATVPAAVVAAVAAVVAAVPAVAAAVVAAAVPDTAMPDSTRAEFALSAKVEETLSDALARAQITTPIGAVL